MAFCDISFKRKQDGTIEVKNKRGEQSPLYSKLIEYTNQNNVYQGREWFFDKLVEQGKLKNNNNQELALGLYSIAFNSDRSEVYWIDKIKELLPQEFYPQTGINEEVLLPENQIQYQFRLVDTILKNIDKVKSWEKKIGLTDLFWQKLTELGISKQQVELLKNSEGKTLENKLVSFSSNYNFAVEINTAKTAPDDYNDLTKEEFDDLPKEIKDKYGKAVSTQYYSNLTVPGGTNYTENEVSTPLITPSIKGHAQFATDKGIGWFRSDDQKNLTGKGNLVQDGFNDDGSPYIVEVSDNFIKTKINTRRILELQSDLFQKGRDKKDLIGEEDKEVGVWNEDIEDYETSYTQSGTDKSNTKENKFLQLLNKDNNWVTFFIKSIVQDSAKKGYEKVLFPTGNTASKIEGHSTLEEFKKQKEDRIKQIEKDKEEVNQNLNSFNGEKWRGFTKSEWYSEFERETNQLKQELERVEKEGFGALRPIFNFYENVVTNILKKQGYNPKLITDEYGNTWNEIVIENQRGTEDILLSKRGYLNEEDSLTEKGFTNIKQYLQYIIDNNEPLSPLARKLLTFNSNVPVIITESPTSSEIGSTVYGAFIPSKNEIRLVPNVSSTVVLHEQIHAITYNWIRENKGSNQVKELERLFEITKTHTSNIKDHYPLKNLDEFITGIFTNSQFIYDLQHIPYKSTSVLTELLKWFSELFRFTPKQKTLFEEVFFKVENLLDTIKEEEIGFEVFESYDLENDYKTILTKYGNVKTSEINSLSEWGKLISDIAKINKKYKSKVLTLYQAPNSKWYLKQIEDNDSPLFNNIPNHRQVAQLNSEEMKINLGQMGEDIVNNWNKYFDEYDFLSESDKRQYVSLIEEGQVQIQCKF